MTEEEFWASANPGEYRTIYFLDPHYARDVYGSSTLSGRIEEDIHRYRPISFTVTHDTIGVIVDYEQVKAVI